MTITPYPIFAADIDALSTPETPVSAEIGRSTRRDRPLAHGWIANAEIEPGFDVFSMRYRSVASYAVNAVENPRFFFGLNLGDDIRNDIPRQQLYLPHGNFRTIAFDEPVPFKNYREEYKRQDRCGFTFSSDWIAAGSYERFDEAGIITRALSKRGVIEFGAAPSALLSSADRLTISLNDTGPLAGLRREAAALAFFAEAFASTEVAPQPRSASRIEIGRIKRVKEMLDSFPPNIEVRLVKLASLNSMSVRSLCRHFRQTYGVTVLNYVASRRMETARNALEHGGATIDQAAHVAGFAHVSNFSHAFRRRYGYAPGMVRRR